MKKTIKVLTIIALAAIIGFSMAACEEDDDDGNGNGSGGVFTLTNIPPEYNGKYAYFAGFYVIGAQSIDKSMQTVTLPQISNGSVNLPLWKEGKKYSGNDTETDSKVYIFDSAQISVDTSTDTAIATRYFFYSYNSVQIVFTNGNATKSWNDGTATWY